MVVWLPGWLQKWPGNVLYDGGLGDLEGLIPWKNRNLGKAPKICGDWRCNLQSSWPWHYFLILWQKIMKCLYFFRSVQLIFSVHLHFIPFVARCILSYQCLKRFHIFIIFKYSYFLEISVVGKYVLPLSQWHEAWQSCLWHWQLTFLLFQSQNDNKDF